MRSFVAIEIPEGLRRLVSERAERAARDLPPARWVRPENYHLTLRFLGEVEASRLQDLTALLRPVFARREPFSLQFGVAGTFPPRRPARVVWLGIVDPTAIGPLALDVARACEGFAERREDRRFSAHLTVARCRRPWPRSAVGAWRRVFPGPATGEPFPITRGVLMRSRLHPGGPSYEQLADFPMGAGE